MHNIACAQPRVKYLMNWNKRKVPVDVSSLRVHHIALLGESLSEDPVTAMLFPIMAAFDGVPSMALSGSCAAGTSFKPILEPVHCKELLASWDLTSALEFLKNKHFAPTLILYEKWSWRSYREMAMYLSSTSSQPVYFTKKEFACKQWSVMLLTSFCAVVAFSSY